MTQYPQSIYRDKYSILQVDFVDNKINRLHSEQVSYLHSPTIYTHTSYGLTTVYFQSLFQFCLHELRQRYKNCTKKKRSINSRFIIQLFSGVFFYFINFKQHCCNSWGPLSSASRSSGPPVKISVFASNLDPEFQNRV